MWEELSTRWTNFLRPDIKRGKFNAEEEQTIIRLHALLGNRSSAIATRLPKSTDNEIKNYWNTHIKKRMIKMGVDPISHRRRIAAFGVSSTRNVANLSHMAQWENARLEAESRLMREANKLVSYNRRQFWLDFYATLSTLYGPLMILGDFNQALYTFDRLSSSTNPVRGWNYLRDFIDDTAIIEVPNTGCHFTWTNNRSYARLDRALCNNEWRNLYNDTHTRTLPIFRSDHSK